MKSTNEGQGPGVVQLEIGIEKLESLFNKGELCAADVSCLNCASKDCIWNLCLTACARRMHSNIIGFRPNKSCSQSVGQWHQDARVPITVKHEHLAYFSR
jgi:hypothetical protein